ncbi:MAG: DUF1801 domain-containing protein [Pirellulales bacterium]
MQSSAATVSAYLTALPDDRRRTLEALRAHIAEHLDSGFEEGMQYGMIGYYVPHSRYPQGYKCDPKQPLPFMALASQKNHLSLYMMCIYGHEGERSKFVARWQASGKKLDMGKSCIRFKNIDELCLEAIAESLQRVTADRYIAFVEAAWGSNRPASSAKKSAAQKSTAQKSAAGKPKAAKSTAKKKVTKKAGSKKVATKTPASSKKTGRAAKAKTAAKKPSSTRATKRR